MPITKQAKKRVRQAEKSRDRNRVRRSKMRNLVKEVYEIEDKEKAEEALRDAVSYLDRMTVKGIIHKNNAARKKARLTKYVNNL